MEFSGFTVFLNLASTLQNHFSCGYMAIVNQGDKSFVGHSGLVVTFDSGAVPFSGV